MHFLEADPLAKSALMEHLAKSWDLAPSRSSETPRVTEEQVAIVEVKLPSPDVEGREINTVHLCLGEANLQPLKPYCKGRLGTSRWSDKSRWSQRPTAYVKYIADRLQARAKGKNLELVYFILPVFDEDSLGDANDTMPLNGEAATLNGDNDKAALLDPYGVCTFALIFKEILGCPKTTLWAMGTSTTRKSSSKFFALPLSSNRSGSRIIPAGFTSYPPKPRIGGRPVVLQGVHSSRPVAVSILRSSILFQASHFSYFVTAMMRPNGNVPVGWLTSRGRHIVKGR
ncbi:LOW QUALITY PROTEIN: hypothetical protein Cgig2_028799 [Carnegiea gigantea]|uniref:Uncharacterized protein n=1 Tax=Carnegiea gigantea TaxID=171969 RepID=A0A9Q1GL68_9CARY|nr:LOW QUALITY PROTEIN: hypothetical protein Cgig2_028799 [Carnegiea gigantea]